MPDNCEHPIDKRKYHKPYVYICQQCGAGINASIAQHSLDDY
jgi:hypothetical protein